ncbi:hypothetical protein BGZ65_007936 [Modicella reniformis]|uniref:Uncharacterized protein n=1 Tax=Modicella reniformis TaxID=1440133 RepID=A0A9P6MFM9_9FUNG|nr:hypothetical protein BGZ65_007936 [Modicella reniformis]
MIRRFRIFDTLGLDSADGNNIQNTTRIFSALFSIKELHLVLRPMMIIHIYVSNQYGYPGAKTNMDSKISEKVVKFSNQTVDREVPFKRVDYKLDEKPCIHMG